MATAKLLGILHYNLKAQTSLFALLYFASSFVYIFHFVTFLRSNTREMYKHSLPPLPLLISLKFGVHKEVIMEEMEGML
jgi:hypothetical protein